MKITLLAMGSRGDVQPTLALGKGLAARGHSVSMLAGPNFHSWIASHGLDPLASRMDTEAFMQSPLGQEWVAKGTDVRAQGRIMERILAETGWTLIEDVRAAAKGADVIVSSFTTDLYAASVAEATGVRHVSAPLQPSPLATRSGPAAMGAVFPTRDSFANLLFGRWVVEPMLWRWAKPHLSRLRDELGLKPTDRETAHARLRATTTVHGVSEHVAPRASDWPAAWSVSGYWFLDEASTWTPPPSLVAFLDAGPAPVCMGFGSMSTGDATALTKLFIEAATRSGQRAIILSGWSKASDEALPDTVYRMDAAPHDWLLPRVSAMVTHGGAGSVAASLRAGRPTVVVPHMSDQLYWGRRVAALGVGPKAILRPRLTAEGLAEAVRRATTDDGIRLRAAAMGAKIAAEDGVGRAVASIEAALGEERR